MSIIPRTSLASVARGLLLFSPIIAHTGGICQQAESVSEKRSEKGSEISLFAGKQETTGRFLKDKKSRRENVKGKVFRKTKTTAGMRRKRTQKTRGERADNQKARRYAGREKIKRSLYAAPRAENRRTSKIREEADSKI
jgi:hypothetical protein